MRALAAEALGTFVLVFAGTGAVLTLPPFGVALAFGLSVFVAAGAHINPAVSLGLWAAGRFPGKRVLPYVLSQVSGALLASLLLRALFPAHPTLGATLPAGAPLASFALETALSFLLMYAVLTASGPTAGAVLGAVVGLEAYFAGPISGASMNPARSLAPALVSLHLEHLWIYLSAPVLGALLAVRACGCARGKACCA